MAIWSYSTLGLRVFYDMTAMHVKLNNNKVQLSSSVYSTAFTVSKMILEFQDNSSVTFIGCEK